MTQIRFVHIDHLRLGSPLTGLAHCPDWLRQVVRGAVRRSVCNVMESAIAARAHFLLISGTLTESSHDLPAAVTWLSDQIRTLQDNGIALVLGGNSISLRALPDSLGAIRWSPDQRLNCSLRPDGRLRFDLQSATDSGNRTTSGELSAQLSLQYEMVPVIRSDRRLTCLIRQSVNAAASGGLTSEYCRTGDDSELCSAIPLRTSRDGILISDAGAPQSLGPHEWGAYGCQVIEADWEQQRITSKFCPADTVRYASEHLTCRPGQTAGELVRVMADRCRAMRSTTGRTVIVDWTISGTLEATPQQLRLLDELTLVNDLRRMLDGGHAGVWPRRILFESSRQLLTPVMNRVA